MADRAPASAPFAPRRLLVTGGAGFIGSNLVLAILANEEASSIERLVVLDRLTYAGHRESLDGAERDPRFTFVHGDVCDRARVESLFAEHAFDGVMHLAAESHVDRSLRDPEPFVRTNVLGSEVLFDVATHAFRASPRACRFLHVSTDEVFGSAAAGARFTEESPYAPSSPYSASKAAADLLALAFHHTHGLPVVVTHGTNTYGPRQLPEKLVPLVIRNAARGAPLPVYGDGRHERDWMHVDDHARGLWAALVRGTPGRRYVLGTGVARANVDLVRDLCDLVDRRLDRDLGTSRALVRHVADRPGHDARCCVLSRRAHDELGWQPSVALADGLTTTVDWYLRSSTWLDAVVGPAYRDFYRLQYGQDCP